MRKTKQELNAIKKKYKVDELYSWSKYHSYKIDKYGWYLRYIKHEKETKDNIYGIEGGTIHDIIEEFYLKKLKYEEMLPKYEEKLFEMNCAGLKYNRKDKKANDKIANKYEECIRLFFQQHIPINTKVITEQFVTIKVGNNIFQGYIDFIHKDKDGNCIITDWKSSTIYKGKKIDAEKGQLVLYAESLIQRGVPIEKIKIRWDFLKYCTITYKLSSKDKKTKLNKIKEGNYLRNEWVSHISKNLDMWLKKNGYEDEERKEMVDTAIQNNNLDNTPKEIQDLYTIKDCYVYIPLNKKSIDNLKVDIIQTINEINQKTKEYDELMELYIETNDKKEKQQYQNNIDKLWWTEINKANEFYFNNLCGYSAKQHKPYMQYLRDLNMFKKKQDEDEKNDNSDDSWLNDLLG